MTSRRAFIQSIGAIVMLAPVRVLLAKSGSPYDATDSYDDGSETYDN